MTRPDVELTEGKMVALSNGEAWLLGYMSKIEQPLYWENSRNYATSISLSIKGMIRFVDERDGSIDVAITPAGIAWLAANTKREETW